MGYEPATCGTDVAATVGVDDEVTGEGGRDPFGGPAVAGGPGGLGGTVGLGDAGRGTGDQDEHEQGGGGSRHGPRMHGALRLILPPAGGTLPPQEKMYQRPRPDPRTLDGTPRPRTHRAVRSPGAGRAVAPARAYTDDVSEAYRVAARSRGLSGFDHVPVKEMWLLDLDGDGRVDRDAAPVVALPTDGRIHVYDADTDLVVDAIQVRTEEHGAWCIDVRWVEDIDGFIEAFHEAEEGGCPHPRDTLVPT